ncbi:ABC transporter substrate-binding protein [Leucobacter aridicollis]|uniref:ABC transporter substrate-binding protein n=1 Tax=Leucobacter aridicollis TaxID=283878 RepID=UPI002104EAD1|nr:ABC transporter substrate-binding protein [Leucobacter aridicollis]UTX52899.1 ABC transporter substrate-binding protein [Leucobacter aridicollis]
MRLERVMRGRWKLAGIAVLASAALTLSACSSPATEGGDTGESRGGQIIVANAEPPTAAYWDPAASFGLVDEQVASLVYDTLLSMDAQGKIGPNLATEWEWVSDTEMKLTVRTDAKFHDGTPVTVDDVVASLNRLMVPGSEPLAKSILLTAGEASAEGDVVTVRTEQPFGPLENSLAAVSILAKADIESPENFKSTANGSGPYKFVSYSNDDITLEANADYWGGAPKNDGVVLRYIADADARQNALLAGQVDITTRTGPNYVNAVKDNSDITVESVSPPSQIVMIYQHNGPLADVKVRQALAYAVDREGIAASIMHGVNPVGFNAIPTTLDSYEPANEKFEFNPEKAKSLLAEAGKAEGLKLTMATSTLVPGQLEIDQAIAQNLKDVGIEVEVTQLEVGEFRTSYPQYDLSMNTLASFNNDPSFILATFTGATGEAVFNMADPEVDELVGAQNSTVGDARNAAINAAATYMWDNQLTLWLSDETWTTLVNNRVTGYERNPLIGEPLLRNASVAK